MKICSIIDCDNKALSLRLCNKHYLRLRKNGDPLRTKHIDGEGETFEERFWSRVAVTADPSKCWEWRGAGLYGHVVYNGKRQVVHRVAFFLTFGHWPQPLGRHSCDNPPCCNPNHILEGTHQDNSDDKMERGRQRIPVKPYCKQGHKFTPENTMRPKAHPTHRVCRTCHYARTAKYWERTNYAEIVKSRKVE